MVDEASDAILACEAPTRGKPSNYPPEFAVRVEGREKRPLGDLFGLRNFGVNLTRLPPRAASALHHRHSLQDEMIFVVEGNPTLLVDDRERVLEPGMVAGFAAGGVSHHLENRTDRDCYILEIGDRTKGDQVDYPHDDLVATRRPEGGWAFARKNGSPIDA